MIRIAIIFCLTACLLLSTGSSAGVIFVKSDAAGANDGTSWPDAYTSVQTALAAAIPLDEIWVAYGTYKPTNGSDRMATFQLVSGVAMYGGFAGIETWRGRRDWSVNETILSGAIGNSIREDNSFHVVTANGVEASTILDGFTITAGYADDDSPGATNGWYGGGILIINGSPTIAHSIIRNNFVLMRGGGILLDEGGTPSFTNVTISNNTSGGSFDSHHYYGKGGGMYSDEGHPSFRNVSFIDNYSMGAGAGLLCNEGGTVIDCEFSSNEGDALRFDVTGTAIVDSCVILNNEGMGLVSGLGIDLTLRNSVIEGNQSGGARIFNALVENVLFCGNSGPYVGGLRTNADVTITNVSFIDNSSHEGGGLHLSNANAVVTNATFCGNRSPFGGTIFLESGSLEVHNTILWGNDPPSLAIEPSASLTFSHSLVEGSGGSAAWKPAFGVDGGNNIDADPLYADDSALDAHLRVGSPAINTGDNSAPNLFSTDLDGKPRIVDGTVDVGAYEFECPMGARLYVNTNAIHPGDGSSWKDPLATLQQALVVACSTVTEIWVAAGTYVPTTSTDRYRTFQLRNGLAIYGGFAGTEAVFHFRNLTANPTVLSGDIASPDPEDNSYHVVTGDGVDTTAVVDGFVITGGYADGDSPHNSGGGMINVTGSPTVRNVRFEKNVAMSSGGAMYNFLNSHPQITNTVFWDNWGTTNGGGVHNIVSNPLFTNVTFNGNYSMSGGAISNSAGNPIMINSILSGNDGGEIVNISSNPIISHSIIEGSGGSSSWNPAYGIDGGNNIDEDPLFSDFTNGDLTLAAGSPAINTGENGAPQLPAKDIAGRPRIIDVIVDMGAYEAGLATGIGEDLTQNLSLRPLFGIPYPNPFNPSVTIRFEMDRARWVELSVFDVNGTLVRHLINEIRGPGRHHEIWDGSDSAGRSVTSGVYFFRFRADNIMMTRKAVLLR